MGIAARYTISKVALYSILLLPASPAWATPGDLDAAFGMNGEVIIGAGRAPHQITGAAAQPDGKYLVSFNTYSSFYLGGGIARFNADHTLDNSWGFRGVAGSGNIQNGVAVGNGYVYSIESAWIGDCSGAQYQKTHVARYLPNGKLDLGFGYLGLTWPFCAGRENDILDNLRQRFNAIAIAPDGKIVAVGEGTGYILVARYLPTGGFDYGFAGKGWTRFRVSSAGPDVAYGVVVQADGRIVVTGSQGNPAAGFVARLTTSGALDTTFGLTGTHLFSSSAAQDCRGLVVEALRIIVGCSRITGGVGNFTFRALTPSGAVDTSFVANTVEVGDTDVRLAGIVRLASGRIVAAGRGGTGGTHAVLAAINADGTPDLAFAGNGVYASPETDYREPGALVWTGSEIVLAGQRVVAVADDVALHVFNASGTRTSVTSSDMSYSDVRFSRVTALSDGRILAAGNVLDIGMDGFVVSRLTASGTLDTSFGSMGHARINTTDELHYGLRALTVQPDGKLLLSGDFGRGMLDSQNIGVARLMSDGSVDTSFNAAGTPGQNYISLPDTYGPQEDPYYFSPPIGRDIRVQSDGKILVATTHVPRSGLSLPLLVRFLSTGTLDSSYGNGGVAKADLPASVQATALEIDAAGKAVVAAMRATGGREFFFARFDLGGNPDNSFGVGGIATLTLPPGMKTTRASQGKLFVLPNGKLLAMFSANQAGNSFVGLVRVEANGAIDSTFGDNGFASTIVATDQLPGIATDATMLPSGSVVLAVNVLAPSAEQTDYFSAKYSLSLARFLSNGEPDQTFGAGGVRSYLDQSSKTSISSTSNGALVMAGWAPQSGRWFSSVLKTVPENFDSVRLLTVKSIKSHGTAGMFSMNLPQPTSASAAISSEPRESGGVHTLVFQFDGAINSIGNATATDTLGGNVGVVSAERSGSDVIVSCTGVPDRMLLTVTIDGVNGGAAASAKIGFLVGDVDGSLAIDGTDVSAIKAHAGKTVGSSTFRFDVNRTGAVTASDIGVPKARAGFALQ